MRVRSSLSVVRMCVAVLTAAGVVNAQTSVSLPIMVPEVSSLTYTLAGRAASAGATTTGTITLRVGPGNQVAVTDLRIDVPSLWVANVPFPPVGSAPATIGGFTLRHAGGGTGVAATNDGQGVLTFSDPAVPVRYTGTASHSGTGLVCGQISSAGAPCNGTYNLGASGVRTVLVFGEVPVSGSGQVSVQVNAGTPLDAGSPNIGMVSMLVSWSGTAGVPTCRADFNNAGGVTVQDIFDFLSAWFAAAPSADFNQMGGISVQDVFDYLAAWFAGCP